MYNTYEEWWETVVTPWIRDFVESELGSIAIQRLSDEIPDNELKNQVLDSCYYAQHLNTEINSNKKEFFLDINDKGRNPIKATKELIRFFKKYGSDGNNYVAVSTYFKMYERGVNIGDFTKGPLLIMLESLKDALLEYKEPNPYSIQHGRLIYPKPPKKKIKNLQTDHLIFDLAFHIRRFVSSVTQPIWSVPLPIPKVRYNKLNEIIVMFVAAVLDHNMTEQAVGERITYFVKRNIKIVGEGYVPPVGFNWSIPKK